jgi:hypothetical protein
LRCVGRRIENGEEALKGTVENFVQNFDLHYGDSNELPGGENYGTSYQIQLLFTLVVYEKLQKSSKPSKCLKSFSKVSTSKGFHPSHSFTFTPKDSFFFPLQPSSTSPPHHRSSQHNRFLFQHLLHSLFTF